MFCAEYSGHVSHKVVSPWLSHMCSQKAVNPKSVINVWNTYPSSVVSCIGTLVFNDVNVFMRRQYLLEGLERTVWFQT